jgi:hypothetical protein
MRTTMPAVAVPEAAGVPEEALADGAAVRTSPPVMAAELAGVLPPAMPAMIPVLLPLILAITLGAARSLLGRRPAVPVVVVGSMWPTLRHELLFLSGGLNFCLGW